MLLIFIYVENKMEMILKYDLLEKYYLYSKILFWFLYFICLTSWVFSVYQTK